MRATQLYAPTLRQVPAEAEVVSHKLMLRAGMIRKSAGGIYTYLPLAWRTLRKIEQIVREEMDAAGGQEIMMPILQPSELWVESGRWGAYGDEMMRMNDRHGREFCLGPTHEELITALIRDEVRSYKQLPLLLYQMQDKFRDERRPRFGLMRGREFIMKDLYSFDKDRDAMMLSYRKMYEAYANVFRRCGLDCRAIEADSGAIGGGYSHEFTALAPSGETNLCYCDGCDYAASDEKVALAPVVPADEAALPLGKVPTPGAHTIDLLCEFLNLPKEKTIKAVAFQNERREAVLVFVRGDHEVNETKAANAVAAVELNMAEDEVIRATGGCPGFMSPIGIRDGVRIIVDATVMRMRNAVTGANEVDMHYTNVNPERDFDAGKIIVADVRQVQAGDPCPRCGQPLRMTRGIEVGQVFALGTKYSEAMRATFLDENGKEQPFVMGCYGIGVSRTMAAAIEQHHDDDGIIWPRSLAPYEAVVVPVNAKIPEQLARAEAIYADLQAAGVDVLLDDRKERAGVKFKDADLIGYPLRVNVGPKTLESGTVEVRVRRTGEVRDFPADGYVAEVKSLLATL